MSELAGQTLSHLSFFSPAYIESASCSASCLISAAHCSSRSSTPLPVLERFKGSHRNVKESHDPSLTCSPCRRGQGLHDNSYAFLIRSRGEESVFSQETGMSVARCFFMHSEEIKQQCGSELHEAECLSSSKKKPPACTQRGRDGPLTGGHERVQFGTEPQRPPAPPEAAPSRQDES